MRRLRLSKPSIKCSGISKMSSLFYPDRILLCDRGTIDGAAYADGDPQDFFASVNTTFEAELARYDGVIF